MFDFFYKIYYFFWTVTKIVLIIALMALALFIVLWAIYPFSARRPPPLRWGMNCVPVPNVLDNKSKI